MNTLCCLIKNFRDVLCAYVDDLILGRSSNKAMKLVNRFFISAVIKSKREYINE